MGFRRKRVVGCVIHELRAVRAAKNGPTAPDRRRQIRQDSATAAGTAGNGVIRDQNFRRFGTGREIALDHRHLVGTEEDEGYREIRRDAVAEIGDARDRGGDGHGATSPKPAQKMPCAVFSAAGRSAMAGRISGRLSGSQASKPIPAMNSASRPPVASRPSG